MLASGKPRRLWPYGLAVSLAGAATGLSLLLAQLAGRPLFILFYAAAGLATWQGGPRAGLLVIALSALAITYLLLPPASSFEVGLEGLVQLVAFVLVALLLTWLVEARRRAEAALAEREKQLRSIIDAAPVLISYIGADLRYRFNNRTYENWFGLAQSEMSGRHVQEVLGEAAYQALRPYFESVLAGQQVSYEQLAPYQSGERYIQATYTPDIDDQGRLQGFVVLVNDISQRKQAEASLQLTRIEAEQVRERLERILAGIKDDFVMYDPDWRYVYVNERAVQTLGYPREQLLGQRLWDLFPEAVGSLFYQKVHQAVAEQREIVFEHYYAPFNKWFENRAYPIADGLLLFTSDITERKQAEERLRRLQEVTSSFAEAQTLEEVRQIILNQVLKAIGANSGGLRLVTREALVLEEYILGLSLSEEALYRVVRLPFQARHPAADAARTGEPVFIRDAQEYLRRYPGRAGWVTQNNIQASAYLPLRRGEEVFGALSLNFPNPHIWDEAEQAFALALADRAAVSYERARLYQETQQLNADLEKRVAQRTEELERSVKELDQFTYIASHDLKAPLRAVKQLSAWIVEDAGELLPESSKTHLAKLQGRIDRMEKLLNDLLMYSRVGRNYYGSVESVNTGALVKEIIEMLAPPPSFAVTVQEGMPALTTSRVLLELVFKNLIENSLKHHHRADGRVEVSACERADFIEFSVKDDGPGIEERFHERIFQIFQTLRPRDELESSGVGLSIVKKAVESQGGSLSLISAEGQGATFYFTWPKNNLPALD